jgi:hypothetical protein
VDSASAANPSAPIEAAKRSPQHSATAVRRAAAVVLIALALTGCLEPGPRDPEIIGVIKNSEIVGDSLWRYTLHTGEEVTIDYDEYEGLDGSAGGQDVGTLLLAGRTAGQDWYMGLPPRTMRPAGLLTEYDCFFIGVFATDGGEFLLFDNGLRLRKADDFDPRSHIVDGRFDNPQAALCVTEDGEVLF